MRSTRIFAAAALSVVLVSPDAAEGQTSALAGRNVQVDEPMFAESATVHRAGGFSATGYFAWFMIDEDEFFDGGIPDDVEVEASAYEVGAGASYGITDRLTVGATLPYVRTSTTATIESESEEFELDGIGDLDLFGRALVWRSTNQATRLAALGTVSLPTADDTLFEIEGDELEIDRSPSYTAGGAVSHDASRVSVHGAVQYTWAGNVEIEGFEGEGIDVLSFSGAGVLAFRPDLQLIGEILVDSPRIDDDDAFPGADDSETTVAGGIRWSASPNMAVDAAVVLPVSEDTISAVLVAGLNLWLR